VFKNITRTIWILSIVSLLNDVSGEMLYPVLPLYFKQIGYGGLMIGIIEGIAEMISGITKIYIGAMSDSFNRRLPFVQLGYFLSAVGKPLVGFSQSMFPVLFSRCVDKLGKGFRSAPRDALLIDDCNETNRAEVFGFHRSMDTLGAVIGPLMALVYLHYHPQDFKSLFMMAIIPLSIASIITFFIKEKKRTQVVKQFNINTYLHYFKYAPSEFKSLMITLLLFALVNSSDMFLLLKLKDVGVSETNIILSYVLFNLVYAIGAFPLGKLSDSFGRKKMFILGLMIYASVYFIFSFTTNSSILFCAMVLYGLFYACTQGAIKALLLEKIDASQKSSALGLYDGLSSIIIMFANILAGFIWYQFGSMYMLLTSAIVTLFIILVFLNQKKPSIVK
jgi:MFS family permease